VSQAAPQMNQISRFIVQLHLLVFDDSTQNTTATVPLMHKWAIKDGKDYGKANLSYTGSMTLVMEGKNYIFRSKKAGKNQITLIEHSLLNYKKQRPVS